MQTKFLLAGAVLAAGLAGWLFLRPGDTPQTASGQGASASAPVAAVTMPATLTDNARIGQRAFAAKCADCHGPDATGRDGLGPPLIHRIYEPSHHGDEAFQLAVVRGVRAHHWKFGDMAPVPGLSRADVGMIVAYIREVQRANGIQ
ncbi:MAG: c-type cytochrome [Marinibacterium sp.]